MGWQFVGWIKWHVQHRECGGRGVLALDARSHMTGLCCQEVSGVVLPDCGSLKLGYMSHNAARGTTKGGRTCFNRMCFRSTSTL